MIVETGMSSRGQKLREMVVTGHE